MSVDYIVIVDFWSLSLLKYATEKGMKNSLKVIELGYIAQGNNVFGLLIICNSRISIS